MKLTCPVEPKRAAVIDDEHLARIGHEVYFFSSSKARDRFLKDPLRWSGRLTDPVTQARFKPNGRSPRTEFDGRTYYFSSNQTRASFLRMPEMYAEAKRTMSPAR